MHLSAVSDALIAAIVAGITSLTITFGKILWDGRQQKHERQLAAREKLDRFREPLLSAADDLGSRINNIRHDHFLLYLEVPERKQTALLGTLFRFAQFFGWTEILYGAGGALRFEQDESTKAVADALREVGRTLAVDRLDRTVPMDFTTTTLMIWREEQRAIGELIRVDGGPDRLPEFRLDRQPVRSALLDLVRHFRGPVGRCHHSAERPTCQAAATPSRPHPRARRRPAPGAIRRRWHPHSPALGAPRDAQGHRYRRLTTHPPSGSDAAQPPMADASFPAPQGQPTPGPVASGLHTAAFGLTQVSCVHVRAHLREHDLTFEDIPLRRDERPRDDEQSPERVVPHGCDLVMR